MTSPYPGTYRGILSDRKITEARENGDLYIAPFDRRQLQPTGYNLTPTRFFYSTTKKKFLPVIENSEEVYVIVDKNDTVLVRTRESVAVSSSLSGAFYSKVKVVSEGFGHVSTTLDPNWEGQLLISLNNPTNKRIKFSIEKKVYGETIYNSFVTLEFTGLDSFPLDRSDNPPGRLDILSSTIEKNISTFKRKQVDELRQLLKDLHECEDQTIESFIINHFTPEEEQAREEIYAIRDNQQFYETWNTFLEQKKRKYLRQIQEDFNRNALKSIEIINTYIDKKQKYMPVRVKFLSFCIKNRYHLFGILISVILGLCTFFSDELIAKLSVLENLDILHIASLTCMGYIILPILKDLKDIFFDMK